MSKKTAQTLGAVAIGAVIVWWLWREHRRRQAAIIAAQAVANQPGIL